MQVKYARLKQVFNGGLTWCVFSLLDPIHVFQCSVWIKKKKQNKTNKLPLMLISEREMERFLFNQKNVNLTPWCTADVSSVRIIHKSIKYVWLYAFTGKTITHLLAKLYIASFLSWKDKCLSAGVFPNDLATGCEEEKRQWLITHFHYYTIYVLLKTV